MTSQTKVCVGGYTRREIKNNSLATASIFDKCFKIGVIHDLLFEVFCVCGCVCGNHAIIFLAKVYGYIKIRKINGRSFFLVERIKIETY